MLITETEIQKYPTIVEHRTLTGDNVFTEEIHNLDGRFGPHSRVIIRCVKCQKVFDIHDPGIIGK